MAEETIKKVDHKNIFAALSAFQGEMKSIEKDGQVDFKKKNSDERVQFKYATLGKTVEIINPVLAKNGLSFRHQLHEKGIECILTHETFEVKMEVVKEENHEHGEGEKLNEKKYEKVITGEISSGVLPLDLTKEDMKDVGGQITYGRRYTLGLVLGLATEEDKDTELIGEKLGKVQGFAFNSAKKGIDNAKTVEDVQKGIDVLKKELDRIEKGKKTTFGLEKVQYEELIKLGEDKIATLEGRQPEAKDDVPAVEQDGDKKGTE